MDIEKAVQARFHADLDTLQRFSANGEGEPRDVVQKVRPILESYCRNLYPTQFNDQETLGGIAGVIRSAGAFRIIKSDEVRYLDEIRLCPTRQPDAHYFPGVARACRRARFLAMTSSIVPASSLSIPSWIAALSSA